MNSLYLLKTCLEDSAFAGTDTLPADLRLRQAAESYVTETSDVEIARALQALFAASGDDRPARLLDALVLVDTALRERAATGVPGEAEPLETCGGYTCAPYSRLRPLIDALTGSGSGRLTILEEAWQSRPEYFSDERVRPSLAAALGDTNEEMEELLAAILSSQGKRAVPCLKDGFAPDGKREMVRRVYWIARLAGAEENAWLLSVLPACRGEVREAAIAALGVSQDNAALLLELYRSESGKCRDAALRALAWMEDEESRALWAEELERRPDCPPCLEGVDSPLAADMAALVLRDAFSEALERGREELDQTELLTLAHAIYAAYGKYSDALRQEWIWCGEQMQALERIRPGRSAGGWELTAAEMLEKCLMETVLWNPCEDVRALTQELAGRFPAHFLGAAALFELLTKPAEAFDRYGKYIVKNGIFHRENPAERANRVQLMRALAAVRWTKEDGRHIPFSRKDSLTGAPAGRMYHLPQFDLRWANALFDAKVNQDGAVYDLSAPWSMNKLMLKPEWISEPLEPAAPPVAEQA